MRVPKVAPIFPAIFPEDKEKREAQLRNLKAPIKVGDMVKEHTYHSKKRTGVVYDMRSNYRLSIRWLDGTVDHLHHIYEVTNISETNDK